MSGRNIVFKWTSVLHTLLGSEYASTFRFAEIFLQENNEPGYLLIGNTMNLILR